MNLFKKIIYAGTDTLGEHQFQKRICVGINTLCLSIIIINLTIGLGFYIATRKLLILIGISGEIILVILPILLNHYRRYRAASITFFLVFAAATFYFGAILGRSVDSQALIIFLIGVSLFMFDDLATQISCAVISLLALIMLEINFNSLFIRPIEASPEIKILMRWAAYGVIIFLVFMAFLMYKKNNTRLLIKIRNYNREIEANLEKKEKELELRDKYVGNAYHELRVSFFSIFAIINVLYKVEKKEEMKKVLDSLKTAFQVSKSIIDNILEFEKHQTGSTSSIHKEQLDIRLLIRNIVDIYQHAADENEITIVTVIPEDFPVYVNCDKTRLNQVITNLLSNAIKFTRYGTNILIGTKKINDTAWQVFFEDKGDGIRREHYDHIFEAFVTTNPKGVGLGLYVVKQLVASLDGKIDLHSELNVGSRFSVTLPF